MSKNGSPSLAKGGKGGQILQLLGFNQRTVSGETLEESRRPKVIPVQEGPA